MCGSLVCMVIMCMDVLMYIRTYVCMHTLVYVRIYMRGVCMLCVCMVRDQRVCMVACLSDIDPLARA